MKKTIECKNVTPMQVWKYQKHVVKKKEILVPNKLVDLYKRA